jgi:hypothetical protein
VSLVANGHLVTSLDPVPAPLDPPELDRLVDFSERPRTNDWSLRAALVRYAQPQPKQVSDLLDLVRRTEAALAGQRGRLEREGPQIWSALEDGRTADADALVVGLLRVAKEFDGLGDDLAEWATDISRPRPDEEVERVIDEVAQQLDVLGVPREERPPGPRNRG